MTPHVKTYLNYFQYTISDFIICEVPNCGSQAVDIHHIIPRSKFGSKKKAKQDNIENLIALCRDCHNKAHANILTKEYLTDLHLGNL